MKWSKAPSALGSGPQPLSQGGTIPRQGPRLDPHPASPSQGTLEMACIISTHRAAPGQRSQWTAVPLGSFSSPVISPYGWLCPRSWWECHDQFQESHCWVKGFHTLAPGRLCHNLSRSSTQGAGGLPRTPLEAKGEDAGSSRQGARKKCGSGP